MYTNLQKLLTVAQSIGEHFLFVQYKTITKNRGLYVYFKEITFFCNSEPS